MAQAKRKEFGHGRRFTQMARRIPIVAESLALSPIRDSKITRR
jgi:hypothetical protein